MSNASSSHPAPVPPQPQQSIKLNPYTALIGALVVILGFLFAQVLALVVISVVIQVVGGNAESLLKNTEVQFVVSLLVYSLLAYIVYAAMRLLKLSFAEIGLGRKPQFADIKWAIPIFVIYFAVLTLVTNAVAHYLPSINVQQQQQLGFNSDVSGPSLILIFFALAVLPPLVEEFVTRGFLLTTLRTKLSIIPAAVITCFIFSVPHLQLGSGAPPLYIAALDTFILSGFLIYARLKTGSLWAGILVHAIKNGLAFAALFIFKVH